MKKKWLLFLTVSIVLVVLFVLPFLHKAITGEYPSTFPLSKTSSESQTPAIEATQEDIAYEDLPEHCKDRIFNDGEEGLDCGWSCPNKCNFVEKCGRSILTHDETWSGNVYVKCYIRVPKGITLTIEPGTIVKFKHDRDYKTFDKASLEVAGGTIKAIGTPEQRIWFTSAAKDPLNGDWSGIMLSSNPKGSEFDHVIVEFAELGISQMDSKVRITNSIIRWSNSEGLYAERSTPLFENNTLYGNGYHEIALEQYNEDVQILNNVFRDGHYAIHHEKTTSTIEGNYFKNYENEVISAGMESSIVVRGNKFENVGQDPLHVYDGSTSEVENNDFGEGNLPIPELGYSDIKNFEIDYVPGDPEDKFPYIYDDADETRRVIKKIGEGLYFGWSLSYADNYLWRFSLGSGEVGESLDFIKVDSLTGDFERFGNNEIMNPRGLTWDGEYFWVNDFSLLKIFKFKLDGDFIKIVDSFDIPEKEKGGTQGLTSDGDFLYLQSRDESKLYKLDKSGNLVDEIVFQNRGVGGAIVWTGEYFWTNGGCAKGMCKWTKDGKLAGEIYQPAKETWALAWDGEYLWTIQRTCEMWDDPKIYQVEILDDSDVI